MKKQVTITTKRQQFAKMFAASTRSGGKRGKEGSSTGVDDNDDSDSSSSRGRNNNDEDSDCKQLRATFFTHDPEYLQTIGYLANSFPCVLTHKTAMDKVLVWLMRSRFSRRLNMSGLYKDLRFLAALNYATQKFCFYSKRAAAIGRDQHIDMVMVLYFCFVCAPGFMFSWLLWSDPGFVC